MEETFYYSRGRRIPVARIQSARVVRLPEDRDFISVPGWHSLPLGNERFQLLIRADLISERSLRVHRLEEELVNQLLDADAQIPDRSTPDEERGLHDELGAESTPVLVGEGGAYFFQLAK